MSGEISVLQNTFARTNKDGLIEIIDEDSGEVVAVQESFEDLFKDKRDRLVEMEIDGQKLLVEKGMNLDNIKLRKNKYRYSGVLADIICQRIAEGESLTTICKEEAMPGIATIYKWRRSNEDFQEALSFAYTDRANYYHDQALKEAEAATSKDDAVVQRLKSDINKWAAEKGDPDRFGSRTKLVAGVGAAVGFTILTGVPQPEERDVTDVEARNQKTKTIEAKAEKEVKDVKAKTELGDTEPTDSNISDTDKG